MSVSTHKSVGLLHPGEMGAAIGAVIAKAGFDVFFSSEGRSPETLQRAATAGLIEQSSTAELAHNVDVIVSVCPPHAARDVARSVGGFRGLYVDADAISPGRALEVGAIVESAGARFCDGGIIGGPPGGGPGRTSLCLSGPNADEAVELFSSDALEVTVLRGAPNAASALKMAYASWTKGQIALLLATRALARSLGVEEQLVAEWARSGDGFEARQHQAAHSAATKGWRWIGEMEEIAETYRSVKLPGGFHDAATDIYRRSPVDPGARADAATLEEVLDAIVTSEAS